MPPPDFPREAAGFFFYITSLRHPFTYTDITRRALRASGGRWTSLPLFAPVFRGARGNGDDCRRRTSHLVLEGATWEKVTARP